MHQKQDPDTLRVEERNWVVEKYFSSEVQAQLASGASDFLSRTTDTIMQEYRFVFAAPRSAEDEAAFKKRQRNARGDRKVQIVRFPAETPADAKQRMKWARKQIYSIVNKLRHRLKKENVAPLPVPTLTPAARPRTQGALDILLKSVMGQQIPTPLTATGRSDPGARRKLGRELLNNLAPELRSELEEAVTRAKEDAVEDHIAQAGGIDEYNRVRMIPELKPYMENVAVYLDNTVHWVMSALAGGPGADGKLSLIPVSLVKDRHGHNFWDALCAHFGIDFDEFKSWCVMWHQQVINAPSEVPTTSEGTSSVSEQSRVEDCLNGLSLSSDDHHIANATVPPVREASAVLDVQVGMGATENNVPTSHADEVMRDIETEQSPSRSYVHGNTEQIPSYAPSTVNDTGPFVAEHGYSTPTSTASDSSAASADLGQVNAFAAQVDAFRTHVSHIPDQPVDGEVPGTTPMYATRALQSADLDSSASSDADDTWTFVDSSGHVPPATPIARSDWVFMATGDVPDFQPSYPAAGAVDPLNDSFPLNTSYHEPSAAPSPTFDTSATDGYDIVMGDEQSAVDDDVVEQNEDAFAMDFVNVGMQDLPPIFVHPGMDGLTAPGVTVTVPGDDGLRKRVPRQSTKGRKLTGTEPLTVPVEPNYGIRVSHVNKRKRRTATHARA